VDKSLNVVGDWIENPHSLVDEQQLQTEAESLRQQLLNSPEQQPFSDSNESDSLPLSLKSALTEEAIQAWLISHLAVYLKLQPDEIDIEESFACYGLDSSVAVSLTGELASVLGYELEPTLFWEYPSIAELAVHLAQECQLSQSACQASA
jgi:acyl carrier protein